MMRTTMKLLVRSLSAGVAACALFGASAHGQCEDQWLPGHGLSGVLSPSALTTWDPDGPGPLPRQMIAGGDFSGAFVGGFTVNRVARWDGAAWRAMGDGLDAIVRALTTWDPDGAGPAEPVLIAAGDFLNSGTTAVSRIARWDGSAWQPLGSGLDGRVNALTTWDPDGAGPATPLLIAGGTFQNAGGMAAARIAAWDGTSWAALGAGLSGGSDVSVHALAAWDQDGAGPLNERLYAGGKFTSSGPLTMNHIAAWDGAAWSALQTGVTGSSGLKPVSAMTTWDSDGPGPLGSELVVVGSLSRVGVVDAVRIARWDGAAWHAFATSPGGTYNGVLVADLDGPGPSHEELIAVGTFGLGSPTKAVMRWTGDAWVNIDSGTVAGFGVTTASLFDRDGDGPRSAELVVAGPFSALGSSQVGNIAYWENGRWRGFGSSISSSMGDVIALHVGDPDGDGPLSEQIIAGGTFARAGDDTCNGLARWDGAAWRAFTPLLSTNAFVECFTEWDPDGTGPEKPLLIVGGVFGTAGSVPAKNIAAWDGSAWHALGTGLSISDALPGVYALTTWDPDGAGPQNELLIAGGSFTSAGGTAVQHIAAWNGSAWSAMGGSMFRAVHTLTTYDFDGAGPEIPHIVGGGQLTFTLRGVARWDGESWTVMGQPPSIVYDVFSFDPDGTGPEVAQLLLSGGPTGSGYVSRWDGAGWPQIATTNGWCETMIAWDPDGTGPMVNRLVVAGTYTQLNGQPINRLAQYDGAQWSGFGLGLTGHPFDTFTWGLTAWDVDGPGPRGTEIFVGGLFESAGDEPAYCFAHWGSPAPWFALHQENLDSAQGGTIALSATPAAGLETRGPASFRWRHNGQEIFDGPTAGGSVVAGSATPTLYITNVQPDDRGDYDCIMTTECGEAASRPASLTLSGCTADLSGDGVVDFGDYLEFLNLYDALDPRVDFNMDGVIDFGDYLEFLNHFDAGC